MPSQGIFSLARRGKPISMSLALTGAAGLAFTASFAQRRKIEALATKAEAQFNTSSVHPVPPGFRPWKIRNDYPTSEMLLATGQTGVSSSSASASAPPPLGLGIGLESKDAPWLQFDYNTQPEEYAEAIRLYCFEGNATTRFRLQDNHIRDWYHAPWMHYRDPDPESSCTEREPINGLTLERSTPALELASTQTVRLQNWACGFYNAAGATVFGDMWKRPDSPDFREHKRFPIGTCVFKVLLNNSTDEQLPNMKGSPIMYGVISKNARHGRDRENFASPLRLAQVDFAVVDGRSPIGWVFGSYVFDGWRTDKDPWERLTLIGLQWGNDPWLTPTVYATNTDKCGNPPKPRESWINPTAEVLRIHLGGSRPSWGWQGRMNGPADNFISACASCHSTAARDPIKRGASGSAYEQTPPLDKFTLKPKLGKTEKDVMVYFRNVPAGVPFERGLREESEDEHRVIAGGSASGNNQNKSADYSLQLQIGWANYQKWKKCETEKPSGVIAAVFDMTKVVWDKGPGQD